MGRSLGRKRVGRDDAPVPSAPDTAAAATAPETHGRTDPSPQVPDVSPGDATSEPVTTDRENASLEDAVAAVDLVPILDRMDAFERSLEKVLAEALQTGDFVRQTQQTLGAGTDAIRARAMGEALEALTRAHSSVALKRMDAELHGDAALVEVLRRIESEVESELSFVGIVPLMPAIGDPIDTKVMRAPRSDIPDGIDHETARMTVASVTACGYQFPDRRIFPTVTVSWHAATDTDPQS